MTLKQYLARIDPAPTATPPDGNLSWLKRRLDAGDEAIAVTPLEDGFPGRPGPALLVEVRGDDDPVTMPLGLDGEAVAFLSANLGHLPIPGDDATTSEEGADLVAELRALFRKTANAPPDDRAGLLMDWIMDRTASTRCALIPFESGTPGPPLVFHTRGEPDGTDLRHVPRQIVAHVARTRQPRISNKIGQRPADPDATAIRQQVRSYMAVPVVFRGDLLAVCYVDRFDAPRRFTDEEIAIFEAFAYELAWPLLALRDEQRRVEYQKLRDLLLSDSGHEPRVVTSPALDAVLERARRLAPHVAENLLILGETGVGKEVVARYVHDHSGRADAPFVAVNVSAISAELFESELMGSVRGAFTGAVDRAGRIAQADGGTLFLDEIGDLALTNQVKLLRFLQDKRITPVGGKTTRNADVRVVAATNRPLDQLVAKGDFREDLYHRFAPPLLVPPLRERREEIVPHARNWLRSKARQSGMPEPAFAADAVTFLETYAWPGNVRQLEAVVAHALLLSTGDSIGRGLLESLVPEQTPATVAVPTTWTEWRDWRDGRERTWLSDVLERHDGRVAAAAKSIDVPLSTLRSLLKRHGLRD